MYEGAAEKIVLEAGILEAQERALASAATDAARAAEVSSQHIPGSGFGLMCAFLPPAMNLMADQIARTAEQVATLAERMHDGVRDGRTTFELVEEKGAEIYARTDVPR